MNLYKELKRRNVFRVGIAYIIIAWLIMQIGEVMAPALHLPDWVNSALAFFIILGFPFAIFFAWAFEMTPEGLKKEREVDRSQSITNITGRKLDFTIIGLLVVAVVYLVLDKFDDASPIPTAETVVDSVVEETVEDATQSPARSIAVLPFANMSDDAANEFFSDGISEEILNSLAHIRELKVAGRTSSFAFKGRNEDLRLIGETLNVSHILEGSVRKAGNTVRITAQLIQVSDGYHLWSETYDRELTDVFAIQDEIAGAILVELKTELMGDNLVATSRTDPRAYEKYLQARQLMYTRTQPELEAAVVLLDEAMALDSDFAPAWAQRGIVSKLLSVQQYGTIPFLDSQAQLKRFSEHALQLDENLAEGWAALGLYHNGEPGPENTALSRQHLEQALAINPSLMDASNWLFSVLINENKGTEAMELLGSMFERDPLYRPLMGNMSLHYSRMGLKHQFGLALERVKPFLKDQPAFVTAEANYQSSIGNTAGSLRLAESALAKAPNSAFAGGSVDRAWFALNEFGRVADQNMGRPTWRIRALTYLGRVEEAMMVVNQFLEASRLPEPMIEFLGNTGQHEALIAFVSDRWGDAEMLNHQQGSLLGFGNLKMIYYAWACRVTGREAEFEQAMDMVRSDHDTQAAAGIKWAFFFMMEAFYWTLAGDHDRAITFLDRAADDYMPMNPKLSRMYPILKPLDGDPRFEAVQAKIRKHVNQQRVEAGLELMEAGNTL